MTGRYYVTVASSHAALAEHAEAWGMLVDASIEPNVFNEPHVLLPALLHLSPPDMRVLLVWREDQDASLPMMIGLFPLVPSDRFSALGMRAISLWQHLYSYLASPLLHGHHAVAALETALHHLHHVERIDLVECRSLRANGAIHQAFDETIERLRLAWLSNGGHDRAMFHRASSAEAFLADSLSTKRRKELRRQERRLGECGVLRYERGTTEPEAWIEEVLALESRGWKGREGSSLQDDQPARAFFRDAILGARDRGRLLVMALRLNGRAIAMKCDLLAVGDAVSYEIAYDETYAAYSPGVLLEIEHVRMLHESDAPRKMDSGAAADHPMINHLWRDRLRIESRLLSTGSRKAAIAIGILLLGRRVRQFVTKRRIRA